MSEHESMLGKMNNIEIYMANKDADMDTDINASAQEAFKYVLTQNDPVGTVAGYYDEKLSIWTISNFFLQILGYELNEFMEVSGGYLSNVICNDQECFLSAEEFRNLHGFYTMYLMDSKGSPILVRIVKTDAEDNEGRPVWVLSARSDRSTQNLELINEMVENGLWSIDYDQEETISKEESTEEPETPSSAPRGDELKSKTTAGFSSPIGPRERAYFFNTAFLTTAPHEESSILSSSFSRTIVFSGTAGN